MRQDERGHTLLNLLGALMIIGVLSATVTSNIKELQDPLADASFEVAHFLRLARSRAMAQTLAVELAPLSASRIGTSSAVNCSSTMTTISDFYVDLPAGASLADTTWSACFTQRGLASSNVTFVIQDSDGQSRTVEIALGGGTRIQ